MFHIEYEDLSEKEVEGKHLYNITIIIKVVHKHIMKSWAYGREEGRQGYILHLDTRILLLFSCLEKSFSSTIHPLPPDMRNNEFLISQKAMPQKVEIFLV